jgi:hypothetical protein
LSDYGLYKVRVFLTEEKEAATETSEVIKHTYSDTVPGLRTTVNYVDKRD